MSYVLKPGHSGPKIFELQEILIASGDLPATDAKGNTNRDGRFGQITRQAIIDYQKKNGLHPDGIVGQATAQRLKLALQEPDLKVLAEGDHKPTDHILTSGQLRKLAEKVDALIPTGPFDFFDDAAILWLVRKLDSALVSLLPPNIVDYLGDYSKGLEGGDMFAFKKRLTVAINKQVNVPLLSEETEAMIIGFFIGLVIDGLRLGRTLDAALEQSVPQPA